MVDIPAFTQSPKTGHAICTAAKTTYGDAANAVLLLTAGLSGSIVTLVTAVPRATAAATQLQIYSSKDDGATLTLIDSEKMNAHTMSASEAVPITKLPLASTRLLAPNERLYAAIGVALAAGVAFRAECGDL